MRSYSQVPPNPMAGGLEMVQPQMGSQARPAIDI